MMDRLTVDYCKKFSPFRYAMKDGSDEEIGYFKNYDAFYSHMLMVQKLGEYEDLDEQGLLLRLPVKVGGTVYAIRYEEENDFVVVKTKVIEIRQNINGTFFETLKPRRAYNIDDFGKVVFLTKAEAKQKLKEMEIVHFRKE